MPSRFDFRGLRCFASPVDAWSYDFVPARPDVRRDSDGQPMLTMIDLGTSGYLVFSATWDARDSQVEALRHEIASRRQEPDAGRIRLSFAPTTSLRCNVLIGDGTDAFQTVATSTTSGIPPYDAAFNLFLEDERLTHAKAALRGERGFLGIEYLADLEVPVSGTATFRSTMRELMSWLRSRRSGSRDIPQLLKEAVECGLAVVTIDVPDQHADGLAVELHQRVLAQAAQSMPRWPEQYGQNEFHVAVTLEQNGSESVRAFADVGEIISTGSLRLS